MAVWSHDTRMSIHQSGLSSRWEIARRPASPGRLTGPSGWQAESPGGGAFRRCEPLRPPYIRFSAPPGCRIWFRRGRAVASGFPRRSIATILRRLEVSSAFPPCEPGRKIAARPPGVPDVWRAISHAMPVLLRRNPPRAAAATHSIRLLLCAHISFNPFPQGQPAALSWRLTAVRYPCGGVM